MAFEPQGGWLALLIVWVVASLFIHVAAKIVLDKSSFLTAMLVALIGTILAGLVGALVDGVLGLVLAIVTWALVCALFYRTGMIKAAVVGLVAWVLYFITVWVIGKLTN